MMSFNAGLTHTKAIKAPKMDYKALEYTLEAMNTRSKAFKMIKEELIARGHWKAKPRGKPGWHSKDVY